MTPRIPLAKPEITEADREAVLKVLDTPHLSMGPRVREFEESIAAYLGGGHAVAVNSGTSALHLAIKLLKIPSGSEVILPSFAFGAVLNAVVQEQLMPVFVDIEKDTYNTTPQLIQDAITPRTRAILAVHTFGRPLDMRSIVALATARGIPVIEDACEALGAEADARTVGSFGDFGVFAFYPNKQITTGEGGILFTRDPKLAEHAARLRNQGRDVSQDWYQHAEIGYSYRISDMNCALGTSQLRRIQGIITKREELAGCYNRRLARIDDVLRPSLSVSSGRASWFCYVIQLREEFTREDRDRVCELVTQKGIGIGRYFPPLHRQPLLAEHPAQLKSNLLITEFVADRVIALPFFNQLAEAEIDEVCVALEDSVSEVRARKI